jgi:serine/threonine protein phosphatase PrpC
MRAIAGTALAAAGLTAALTGAASPTALALAPAGDGKIITCRDGRPVERELTTEDRRRIEELRRRAAESPDGKVRVQGEGEGKRTIIVGGRDGRSPEEICARPD